MGLSSKNLKKSSIKEKENTDKEQQRAQMDVSVMDMVSGLDVSTSEVQANVNEVSDNSEGKEDTAVAKANTINSKLQKLRLKANSVNKVASRPSKKGDIVDMRDAFVEPVEICKPKTPVNTDRIEIGPSASNGSLNSTARSPKALIATRKTSSAKDTFSDDVSKSYVKASKYYTLIPF